MRDAGLPSHQSLYGDSFCSAGWHPFVRCADISPNRGITLKGKPMLICTDHSSLPLGGEGGPLAVDEVVSAGYAEFL